MSTIVTLTGISEAYTADQIECLVRTAGEAVCGDIDDLSSTQLELAESAFSLLRVEEDQSPDAEPLPRPHQRLVTQAEELDVDMLDLDDVVHVLHSKSATQINNNGLNAQVRYLLDQLGETETEQVIHTVAPQRHVDQE